MLDAIQNMDFAVLDAIQSIRSGVLDAIMEFITHLGDGGFIWIALALLMLFVKKYRPCGAAAAMGLLMGLVIGNGILKNLIARERPCWINEAVQLLIESPHDFSFPSGHTLSGFVVAIVIFRHDKRFGVPALVLAALIAFSRLYLYVHFPTDVIAAIVLAIILAIASDVIVTKLIDMIKKTKAASDRS